VAAFHEPAPDSTIGDRPQDDVQMVCLKGQRSDLCLQVRADHRCVLPTAASIHATRTPRDADHSDRGSRHPVQFFMVFVSGTQHPGEQGQPTLHTRAGTRNVEWFLFQRPTRRATR
jgi:hypothetical protein